MKRPQALLPLGGLHELVDHGPPFRRMLANLRGTLRHLPGGATGLNHCRVLGDRCDLSCQKRCRAYGGPLLDITGPLVDFAD
jgi:hypothetical protein